MYTLALYNRKRTQVKASRIGLFFRKKLIMKIGSLNVNKRKIKKFQLFFTYKASSLKKAFIRLPKISITNARYITLLILSKEKTNDGFIK